MFDQQLLQVRFHHFALPPLSILIRHDLSSAWAEQPDRGQGYADFALGFKLCSAELISSCLRDLPCRSFETQVYTCLFVFSSG